MLHFRVCQSVFTLWATGLFVLAAAAGSAMAQPDPDPDPDPEVDFCLENSVRFPLEQPSTNPCSSVSNVIWVEADPQAPQGSPNARAHYEWRTTPATPFVPRVYEGDPWSP